MSDELLTEVREGQRKLSVMNGDCSLGSEGTYSTLRQWVDKSPERIKDETRLLDNKGKLY